MSIRAIVIGLLLGLAVASLTHFNDQIIQQTYLIGNHLPPIVFGFALLLLLVGNPLLRLAGDLWMFRPGEIATVIALGLVVCGWPASNLMRIYGHLMAMPAQQRMTQAHWEAANTFAYVPGGPPYVASGYVRDWPALEAGLREPGAPVLAAVREAMPIDLRRALAATPDPSDGRALDAEDQRRLMNQINRALRDPDLLAGRDGAAPGGGDVRSVVTAHRAALDAALPGVFAPSPRGSGVLLNEGEPAEDRAGTLFAPTADVGSWPDVRAVDWALWWPTLRLWIGLALLVGLATLCMVMIVHPQWSRRELLPYPTVRFVEEITRWSSGRWLPDVASSKLFWIAALVVVVVHTLNGLNVWFPEVPTIPRDLDFQPLRQLFPNASRVTGAYRLFYPTIFFAVVGFGYFVNTQVSFSLGISLLLWVMLGALMLGFGEPLTNGRFSPDAMGPLMRLGSYAGLTLIVLFLGRRYYLGVARGALGLPRGPEVPGYAVWALRMMLVFVGGAAWLLVHYGGVGWVLALLMIGSVLMIGLVLTRVNAETGLFYAQPDFIPVILFAGLLGYEGIGPEALVVLTLASLVLAADPREAVGPYVANALELEQRIAKASPRRSGLPLALMLVIGLVVAVVVTLTLQHHFGLSAGGWARGLPRATLNQATHAINALASHGRLEELTGLSEIRQLAHAKPQPGVIFWLLLGGGLVFVCAAARLRLPWWPIHPVLFIVWGTYPGQFFAFSFLLAAAIKFAIVRVGGAKAYQSAKPLMVGLIAAEIFMVLVWSLVGTIHFFLYQTTPLNYRIFPG